VGREVVHHYYLSRLKRWRQHPLQVGLEDFPGGRPFYSQARATPDDVVAMALEVFNVITDHLSRKDSSVILYTVGESLQTLNIKSGSTGEGVRTVYKRVQPPKK
jgi:hypothetical protein